MNLSGRDIRIELFDKTQLPRIVQTVEPLWSMVDWDADFKNLDVEFIVRHNIFPNDLGIQMTENGRLLAAAFAAPLDAENDACQWLAAQSGNLSQKEQSALRLVVDYLEEMDERTCRLMTDSDIRLSLLVSLEPGFGSLILEEITRRIRRLGFRNLYLWTDCDCNHQFYPRHGFTLVEKAPYHNFSTAERDFTTYIFKKEI